jgi:excisionase family DNA binding protein
MKNMTVPEAAAILGLTPQAVRRRIHNGDMRAERIGARLWLISPREVERWQLRGRIRQGRPRGNANTRRTILGEGPQGSR